MAESLGLSAEDLALTHNPKLGPRTEFTYRMAWARSSLKKAGLIEKVAPGVWAIQDAE